jgi:hypothetical protein
MSLYMVLMILNVIVNILIQNTIRLLRSVRKACVDVINLDQLGLVPVEANTEIIKQSSKQGMRGYSKGNRLMR